MSTTIKRSQFRAFLNTTPSAAATYSLVGDGVTDASISYNPQTKEEIYIHQDSGNTEVESYKPTLPIEATAKKGDAVFAFVDGLRRGRKTLGEAQTDVVLVYLYEDAVAGAYPAEKQPVSIQIDEFGGPGGESAKINYTINFQGDAVQGTFNPETLAFVETP